MGVETVGERGGVTYRELAARSLLNRCNAPRMPFAWTVNPYRGCAMGCRYCYAAYTHEFMGIAGADFHSLVYVKAGGDDETAPPIPTSPQRRIRRSRAASWKWWRAIGTCASGSSRRGR